MDSLFYIVSALVALGVFVLIGRNLIRLDRIDRERMRDETPNPPTPPAA